MSALKTLLLTDINMLQESIVKLESHVTDMYFSPNIFGCFFSSCAIHGDKRRASQLSPSSCVRDPWQRHASHHGAHLVLLVTDLPDAHLEMHMYPNLA